MSKNKQMDDFWDLSKLVPKRKPINTFSAGIKTVEHTIADSTSDANDANERKLTFSEVKIEKNERADDSYEPKNTAFLKKITIKRTLDRFDFYGNFRKAALVYFDYKTQKCDFVPFYSYTPQYSQLTTDQKNYYFYWREEVRRGNYIRSDYSYVILYAYEILNLPDLIPPKDGLKALALLWKSYRAELPRLDSSFAVWVQDYCLVHKLECPIEIIGDFMHGIIELSGFPEFYLSSLLDTLGEGVGVFVSYFSDYDWRRSRYATSDEGDFYKKHMLRTMSRLVSAMRAGGEFISSSADIKSISRSAFPKSLLTHSVKCTLEIEYYSILTSPSLRTVITNAVRYTENKIRAALGIKSRLAVKEIDSYHKHVIDKYFEVILAQEIEKRRIASIPEYEKLYEAPRVDISVSGADEIERASWLTTERLIAETIADEYAFEALMCPEKEIQEINEDCGADDTNPSTAAHQPVVASVPSGADSELLRAILSGTARHSVENDLAAERLNEVALDVIGDVIIEILGDGYSLIEDYRDEAERLFEVI